MNRAVTVAAVLLLTIGIAGCAPAVEAAPEATPTTAEVVEAESTALDLCELMGEKFLDYPDYVLAISGGDVSDQAEYLAWGDDLTEAAPSDARTIVAKYTDPIYQVQNVLDAGGGKLQFSSADFKAGSTEILEYCVDAGYKMNQ